MQDPRLVRADFLTALCLVALGLGTVAESWNMPRLEEMNINPYTVPGLVPGIIGVVLTVLGSVLLVRSAHAGGYRLRDYASLRGLLQAQGSRRAVLALVLTVGYAAGLIGRTPFWLATFLFVLIFIVSFEWRVGRTRRQTLIALALATVVAVLTSALVTVVFQYVFLVRLP